MTQAPSTNRSVHWRGGRRSEFEDAVVAGIIDRLDERSVYIELIDVGALAEVHAAQ